MLPVCTLLCTGTRGRFWAQWGGLHLSGLQVLSVSGTAVKRWWQSSASFAFSGVCAAFAVSWNILVREHLWYFLSGAACLPLERTKRHQKALIFKAFLGKDITILCFLPYSSQSSSHKNKQIAWWVACIQHLAKLDQFAKCWCLFSWMT